MQPFICPVCRGMLRREGGSLRCDARHTFDIARQGYVNLLPKKPDTLYEDKALFAARRAVYEAGFFDPLVEAILQALPMGRVLDAGCGEGSLLGRLLQDGREGIGLDIAKPAVQMAAGSFKEAAWCVGDLCNIPLADASVDAVVNVLTPANYGEFLRVLRPEGRLLKVVPGPDHLREIRTAAGKSPYAHTLEETLSVFTRYFDLVAQAPVHYTVACSQVLAGQVFTMTPMTAHVAEQAVQAGPVTVDTVLLIGAARKV